ncbi:PREDICTED: pentatricopeptide repeat-containing protein At2g36980, mitochondrial-like [Populus euphratica]|uniref:Pentatricopeptide repeat-containing protein At2g36980, mitochondrial-like n=1 Tax=Populus euphratica TaxID=75702 RepID=A0AAJ6TI72_POPEU|nr:PREDICTED: pentatricopeptide repeat-containing protein At2g36980, mitochondrial-like [Populus euphratica]XP_011010975.1 PREDICTED: pentatricopeptide repeat-containing protein At2g36980, mitochondrial-like [Populus euphratica]
MHSILFQITSKISSLARSGYITHARKLFDEMTKRDAVAWNSMLTGYSHLGLHQEALSLFHQMRTSNTKPDHFTFTTTLNACGASSSLRNGTKIHALVIVLGCQSSIPVNNSLIDMYGKCLCPFSANKVFQEMIDSNEVSWGSLLFAYTNSGQFDAAASVFKSMPKKVDVAWNIMISGLGQYGEIELCLEMFKEMRESFCEPDQWTYSALISACNESLELVYGCMMHAVVIKTGWSSAMEANNSILSFYAKLGSLNDAVKVFESMGTLTQVSWNAIIDVFMKAGDTSEAFLSFQRMPDKNVVSWTSMITGYARNGYGEEALDFFVGMIRNCLLPDDFTFGAVLHACSSLAILGHGRMVHGCVIHHGFHAHVYIGNGLVNMYAKCGDLEGSNLAFNDIYEKDLVSFNSMLFAFGLHGKGTQALQLYEDMVASGIKPDKVTFIGLFLTCSHSGLIVKGLEFFESMRLVHGLSFNLDHVACMVDMLGRGGYLAEAKELAIEHSKTGDVKTSSCEPLLGACSTHGEVETGTNVGETLKDLEPHKETSYYVLRSNLYCASGRWKEAEMVRKEMVDEGLKKIPGCSWIEVGNKVTAFVAGQSQPCMEELHTTLHFLELEMRHPCFIDVKIEEILVLNSSDRFSIRVIKQLPL